jgi:hypothetical protein
MKCLVLCAALLASASPLAAATYTQADFSGGVYPGGANVKAPFGSPDFYSGMPISGNFVIQDDLIPVGQGFHNVSFSSFTDIGSTPAADAFTINIGSLTFNLSDDVYSAAALQFNNSGTVIGFIFNANFQFAGEGYQLASLGSTWVVNKLDANNNPILGTNYLSGYYNQGRTNATAYTLPGPGPVPEPAMWAMMIAGYGMVGGAMRSRQRRVKVSFG